MTGNSDGSVSLFNGAKLIKTKKLDGADVSVGYFNGQIAAAVQTGNLTIMNASLEIIKEFPGTNYKARSIHGNATYLAFCDYDGSVQYYKRNDDMESKVVFLSFLTHMNHVT